jgi:hypothetical protein
MRIRFQADADLDGRIIRGLRRVAPELNMRSAAEAGLAAVEGSEVLRLPQTLAESSSAKTAVRCRITFNALFRTPRVPIAVAIEELFLIWAASEAEEWINRLAWIPLSDLTRILNNQIIPAHRNHRSGIAIN